MGTVTMIVCAGALLMSREQLGALFSQDREVVLLTSQAVPTLAISLIGEFFTTLPDYDHEDLPGTLHRLVVCAYDGGY